MHNKQEKIIEATIALFLREGAHKVTMEEIAQNANASKMTVYRHFADKDALYAQVARRIAGAYAADLAAVSAAPQSLRERLAAALAVMTAFTDSGRYALCAALSACNPAAAAAVESGQAAYRDTLRALIGEGLAASLFREELDRDMIFYTVDMGVRYYQQNQAYREKLRVDGAFRQRYMQFLLDRLFRLGTAGEAAR